MITTPVPQYPTNNEQMNIFLILNNETLRKMTETMLELNAEVNIKNLKLKLREMKKGDEEDKTIERIEEKF